MHILAVSPSETETPLHGSQDAMGLMMVCARGGSIHTECFGQAYRLSHGGNVEDEEIVAWDETLRRCDGNPHIERVRVG